MDDVAGTLLPGNHPGDEQRLPQHQPEPLVDLGPHHQRDVPELIFQSDEHRPAQRPPAADHQPSHGYLHSLSHVKNLLAGQNLLIQKDRSTPMMYPAGNKPRVVEQAKRLAE